MAYLWRKSLSWIIKTKTDEEKRQKIKFKEDNAKAKNIHQKF